MAETLSLRKDVQNFALAKSMVAHDGLRMLEDNALGFICVLDHDGKLLGVLTDGDIRRKILEIGAESALVSQLADLIDSDFIFAREDELSEEILKKINHTIKFIPIVDTNNKLIAVGYRKQTTFSIGDRPIGSDHPVFVIAEIGNNHNGCFDRATDLVRAAVVAGADCVKFQMRNLDALFKLDISNKASLASEDLGFQYTSDLIRRFELVPEKLFRLFDLCHELNVIPMCTPWDIKSFEALQSYGLEGYKVASADFTNHEFLRTIAESEKPLICSTGMTSENELHESVSVLTSTGAEFALLHCNSAYPAPFHDVNLKYMSKLMALAAGSPVGYSGHERGIAIPIAAVAMGAVIIEKHFTLDRTLEGIDHRVSLLPDEFSQMTNAIRNVEEALGSDSPKTLSQGERMNREVLGKSIYAAVDIPRGTIFSREMVDIKSPGNGLPPYSLDSLLGRVSQRNIACGAPFKSTDLGSSEARARNFEFTMPFGLPVRYHDYKFFYEKTNLALMEFHLSYMDLDLDLNQYFSDDPLEADFLVHAPELFEGDKLLDLADLDSKSRNDSLLNMLRVTTIAQSLKRYFVKETPVRVVVNVGGFSHDGFLTHHEKVARYNHVASSLKALRQNGVELLPQTMPPFPWHFGGQRFHNLFVDPDEIVSFCTMHDTRICLDISHAQLACNFYGWDLVRYVDQVSPFVSHLHIADARGVGGEGLQIGDGEIEFHALAELLLNKCHQVSFIPEIWQGHTNGGGEFWSALESLEIVFSRVSGKV